LSFKLGMVKKIYTRDFFLKCLERDNASLDPSKELPEQFNAHVVCPYLCKCGRARQMKLERIHKSGALCIECGGSAQVYDEFALLRYCRENDVKLVTVPTKISCDTHIEGYCKGEDCCTIWIRQFKHLINNKDPSRVTGPYCSTCRRHNVANVYRNSVTTEKTKKCSVCKLFKDKECFGKDKHTWDKLTTNCKGCAKDNRVLRREYTREYGKIWRKKNKDRIAIVRKEYYKKNKKKIDAYRRKHYKLNKKMYKINSRKSYLRNKEKVLHDTHLRYKKNKKHYLDLNRIWRRKNKDILSTKRKQRLKSDENYALKVRLRGRLRHVFKGNRKSSTTKEYLGISEWEDALDYFKLKNPEYGTLTHEIHIDHIIPFDIFDFTNPLHILACCHYTNLQYLTSAENGSKQAKLPPGFNFNTWLQKQLIQIARIENENLSWEDVLQLQKEKVFQGYVTDDEKWW